MRNAKGAAALLLALVLSVMLGACGSKSGLSKFDAETYVDGLLKEIYLGQFEESYMELVGTDRRAAEDNYEMTLELEASYFVNYCYSILYPTEEYMDKLKDLYEEIYSHTKYEIVSVAEQDDGSFAVKLSVEPINIFQLVDAGWEEGMEKWYTQYPTTVLKTLSSEEYEAADQKYAGMVLDLFWEKMADIGNEAARTITVQLEKNEDGYYVINQDDLNRLDELIINYTIAEHDHEA